MKFFKNALISTISIVLILTSCSSEEKFSISETQLTMHYGDTEQLSATDGSTLWKSYDKFIAEVNENGLVKANHVGKTKILATSPKGFGECEVEVVPVYSLYKEPYLSFGVSKAIVKNNEKRNLYNEETYTLVYEGDDNVVELIMYSFDNWGRLESVSVALSLACANEIAKFLAERYQPIGEENGKLLFKYATGDCDLIGISLSVERYYISVTYISASVIGRNADVENKRVDLNKRINDILKNKNLN